MPASAFPTIVQPNLILPLDIQARIDAGELYRIGGVVRDIATKQIAALLDEAPDLELVAEDVGKKLLKVSLPKFEVSKLNLSQVDLKKAGGVVAGAALLGIGISWGYAKWRRAAKWAVPGDVKAEELVVASVEVPESMTNFGRSLEAYLTAAREARLSPEIIEQLASDLTAVQAYSEEGNAVSFTLDELLPFFEVVTAHTLNLATAYSVELDDLDDQDSDEGVVLNLRRHLETQRQILANVA
ncbi:hypothetical protein ASG91_08105 [Phycicoccus sp. Soil802]|nr:hypothetical protein ASG91_08105 [Phycicoccus sp. Soil802]